MTIGFSTRLGGVSPAPYASLNFSTSRGDSTENVAENRQRFFHKHHVESTRLAQPVQISGSHVGEATQPGLYADTDALITNKSNLFLTVLTADCSPILFWDTTSNVVGAVHSGWQGSAENILGKALKLAMEIYQLSPDTTYLAIGPGLSVKHFEVGLEFEEKFPLEYLTSNKNATKYYFDNNRFLRDTALGLSIPKTHIDVLPYCSFADDELFFSHRRDQGTTGRMMSIIGWNT